MLRGLYVTGISLAFLYMVGSILMVIYIGDMRHNSYYNTYDYSYSGSYNSRPHVEATRVMGGVSALIMCYYIFLYIFGMVKARQSTVMVMGILGLIFTAIAMLIDLFMTVDARHTTFDEIGPAYSIWAFFMIAFCIPCAILTGKKQLEEYRRKKEMQQMMFQNPYYWQNQQNQQQQYFQQQNPYNQQQQFGMNFNPQQQQNFNQNQNFSQQNQNFNQQNQNPNFNPQNPEQNQNPEQQKDDQNPYQYFNPYNPPKPPMNPPIPPEN